MLVTFLFVIVNPKSKRMFYESTQSHNKNETALASVRVAFARNFHGSSCIFMSVLILQMYF